MDASSDIKRTDNDLDSFELGSPTKAHIKLYVNSRTDTKENIQARIELLVFAQGYAATVMNRELGYDPMISSRARKEAAE
jgi:hypothetical protein